MSKPTKTKSNCHQCDDPTCTVFGTSHTKSKDFQKELITLFVTSGLDLRKDPATDEFYLQAMESLRHQEHEIRESIVREIEGMKEYRHLDLPDPLIRKLDVLAIIDNKKNETRNS